VIENYKTYYGYLLAAGIVAVFVLIAWFGLLPYVTNTYEKYQVRQGLKERIELVSNWEDRYQLVQEHNAELTGAIERITTTEITENESYRITELVYNSARNQGIEIQSVEHGELTTSDGKGEQNVLVELLGNYHGVAQFLESLERSEYGISINSVFITSGDTTPRIEGEIDLTVNYIPGL